LTKYKAIYDKELAEADEAGDDFDRELKEAEDAKKALAKLNAPGPITKLPQKVLWKIFSKTEQSHILHGAAINRRIRMAVTDECEKWVLGPTADDSVLRALTQLFGNLKIVEGGQSSWKASRSIGDSGVSALAGLRETLHTVRFPWLTKLSDNAIRLLAFDCADSLTNLNVSECAGLSNAAVEAVAKSCNVLKVFEFAGCVNVNDTAMETVAKHLKCLEGIDFSGCPKITDVGAIPVVREMTKLRCLRMKDLFHVTDETIKTAANHQPHLSELVVENDWLLHDESLQMICANCPKMMTLNLAGCGSVTDLTLLGAASRFTELVRVDCSFLRHLTDVRRRHMNP